MLNTLSELFIDLCTDCLVDGMESCIDLETLGSEAVITEKYSIAFDLRDFVFDKSQKKRKTFTVLLVSIDQCSARMVCFSNTDSFEQLDCKVVIVFLIMSNCVFDVFWCFTSFRVNNILRSEEHVL